MEDNIQCDTNETIKTITTQTITQTTILETTQQTTQKTTVGVSNANDAAPSDSIEYPPFLYVLSDNVGYVGSYYSISDVEEITSAYHLVTFMIQCFKTSKTEDLLTVWVVLYRDIDAVAYVSNNRMDAVKVHSVLMQMGIAYMDCIDYWKQPVGLSKSAKDRLDAIHSIKDKKLLDDSYNIFIQKLNLSNANLPNGPIEQLINETQKISIIDAIIPSIVPNGSAAINDEGTNDEGTNEEDANDEGTNDEGANDEATNENAAITNDGNNFITDHEDAAADDDNIEQLEKELYQRIKDKKARDDEGVAFCENCKVLSNEFYNVMHNSANTTNNAAAFEKTLMSFIANHCYLCFHNIRNFYRQASQKKIKNEINYPIDSPFISTSKNNIAPKVNDKLSEAMKNLTELMQEVPSPEDLQNLSADELLNKYGSDMIPETKEA